MTTLDNQLSASSQDDHREAIKVLKARYFRLIDTKDWETLGTIFASDVVYTDDAKQLVITSATSFIDFLSERHEHSVTVHQGHMPEIALNLTYGTATAIWAMQDIVRIPSAHSMIVQQGYGHYHDSYAFVDGNWQIKSTHLTRLWLSISTETLVRN
jgi:hypothetical protein